jgi:hypothetical protein
MRCKGTDLQADTEEFWLFDNQVTKLGGGKYGQVGFIANNF